MRKICSSPGQCDINNTTILDRNFYSSTFLSRLSLVPEEPDSRFYCIRAISSYIIHENPEDPVKLEDPAAPQTVISQVQKVKELPVVKTENLLSCQCIGCAHKSREVTKNTPRIVERWQMSMRSDRAHAQRAGSAGPIALPHQPKDDTNLLLATSHYQAQSRHPRGPDLHSHAESSSTDAA